MPEPDERPPIDPATVRLAYRQAQASRRARIEHRRHAKRAGMRFRITLLVLVAGAVAIAYGIWHELQRLLGS